MLFLPGLNKAMQICPGQKMQDRRFVQQSHAQELVPSMAAAGRLFGRARQIDFRTLLWYYFY